MKYRLNVTRPNGKPVSEFADTIPPMIDIAASHIMAPLQSKVPLTITCEESHAGTVFRIETSPLMKGMR